MRETATSRLARIAAKRLIGNERISSGKVIEMLRSLGFDVVIELYHSGEERHGTLMVREILADGSIGGTFHRYSETPRTVSADDAFLAAVAGLKQTAPLIQREVVVIITVAPEDEQRTRAQLRRIVLHLTKRARFTIRWRLEVAP